MSVYVALLRAVNVGGTGLVRMEGLRTLLSRAGLENVQTLLQSGNIVFRSAEHDGAKIEARLEALAAKELHVSTEFFVRTADEWEAIIAGNPFPREAREVPGLLVVTTLKESPLAERWRALEAAIKGPESVAQGSRHAYIVYPDGSGRSRLTPNVIERNLGTRGTSRNWNTVTKLGALASRT